MKKGRTRRAIGARWAATAVGSYQRAYPAVRSCWHISRTSILDGTSMRLVKKYRNLARCSQQASITRIGQSILWLSKTLDLPDIVCLVLFLPPRVYIGAHRIKCAIIGAIIDDDDFKGIIGQRLSPQAS